MSFSSLGIKVTISQVASFPGVTLRCHSCIFFISVTDGCMRKLSPSASSRSPLLVATSLTPLPLLLLLVPLQRSPPAPACNPLNKSGFPTNSRLDLSQTIGLDLVLPPPVSVLCAFNICLRDFSVWQAPFWSRELECCKQIPRLKLVLQ